MAPQTATLSVEVVTPDGRIFAGTAEMVELPTACGQLGIFPGHVPLFAELSTGEILLHSGTDATSLIVSGGYVEITGSAVRVLALFASDERTEYDIEAACRRAKSAMETAVELTPSQLEAELGMLKAQLARGREKRGKMG